MVAVPDGSRLHAGDVAAGVDLGEAVRSLRVTGRDPRDVLLLELVGTVIEHRSTSPSFEMNVNSDDEAQTRATSSTAIACARRRHLGRRKPPGNASPANPASRQAVQLAAGNSSRSSAAAAFGAMRVLGEPAHRRAERLVLLGEIEHPLTVEPYIVG